MYTKYFFSEGLIIMKTFCIYTYKTFEYFNFLFILLFKERRQFLNFGRAFQLTRMLIRRPRLTGLNVRSRNCMPGQLCLNPVFKNSLGIVLFKINITQGYVVLKVFMTIAVFLLFILLKNNNNWENRLRYVTQNTSKTIFGLTDLHEVFKLQLKVFNLTYSS